MEIEKYINAKNLEDDSEIDMEVDPKTGDIVFHPHDVDVDDPQSVKVHEMISQDNLRNPGNLDS